MAVLWSSIFALVAFEHFGLVAVVHLRVHCQCQHNHAGQGHENNLLRHLAKPVVPGDEWIWDVLINSDNDDKCSNNGRYSVLSDYWAGAGDTVR